VPPVIGSATSAARTRARSRREPFVELLAPTAGLAVSA
jgi:hypothetical protein